MVIVRKGRTSEGGSTNESAMIKTSLNIPIINSCILFIEVWKMTTNGISSENRWGRTISLKENIVNLESTLLSLSEDI